MKMGTEFHHFLGFSWQTPPQDQWEATDYQGSVTVELRPDLCGPSGSLEGGVIATLIDVAGTSTAVRALRQLVVTRDLHISYLAPARAGPVVATAVALRVGRDSVVSHVRVVDTGAGNVLVAAGTLGAKSVGISIPIGPDGDDREGRG